MNELLSDTKAVLLGLIGLIVTLASWIWRHFSTRVDKLESEAVKRSELDQLREDMRREQQGMHGENQRCLMDIKTSVDETREVATDTHRRIDDLYRDLLKR